MHELRHRVELKHETKGNGSADKAGIADEEHFAEVNLSLVSAHRGQVEKDNCAKEAGDNANGCL